ncbi:MAG: hypothetical protein K6G26_12930 [Lachnospiraceae bacterium]|nr:hypothetical protein [Lachnospiraceae bacterium]
MLCPKCNSVIGPNGICPNCGTYINNANNRENKYLISSKENMERKASEGRSVGLGSKFIVHASVLVGISLIVSIIIALSFTSYVDKTLHAIEERKSLSKAKEYYENRIRNNKTEKEALFEQLDDYLDGVIDMYNKNLMDNQEAKEKIAAVSIVIEDYDTVKYNTDIENLKSSKAAYEDGYTSSAKGEHIKAIRSFGQVSEIDMNYENAQSRIDYEKLKYKGEIKDNADAALEDNTMIDKKTEAIREISEALNSGIYDKNDEELNKLYDRLVEAYTDVIRSEVDKDKTNEQYEEAYNRTKEGLEIVGGSNDKLQECQDKIVEEIVRRALTYAEKEKINGNYTDANVKLVEALEYSPNNAQIIAALKTMVSDLAGMAGKS